MKPAVSLLLVVFAPGLVPAAEVVLDPGRHPTPVFVARAGADGKTVVTLGTDRCVRVWDPATGKQLRVLWLPSDALKGDNGFDASDRIWLAPDGKTLAASFYTSAEPRGKLALVPLDGPDVGTYRVIGGNGFQVNDLVFSPDGKRVATADHWYPAFVWDVATGKQVCEIKHDPDLRPRGMAFTPDGKKLTVSLPMVNFNGEKTTVAATYDVETGKVLSEFKRPSNSSESFGRPFWSPDGKTLAFHRFALDLRTPDGKLEKTIGAEVVAIPPQWPEVAAFDAKGRLLTAWRGGDGEWIIRDETAGKELVRPKAAPDARLSFTAGGHVLVAEAGQFTLVDLAGGAAKPVPVTTRVPGSLGWAKGPTLAWGFDKVEYRKDGRLEFALDFSTLKVTPAAGTEFTRTRKEWDGVKLTDDGYRATATAGGKAVPLEYEPELDSGSINASTLVGPTHAVLATGEGTYAYDTKTGKATAGPYKDDAASWVLAVSPDGKFFAMASGWTPMVRVYRPTSAEPVLTLFAAGGEWVAWTPDGAWASTEGAEKWAGTLSKPAAGKLPQFVPLDPKKRDPDKVRAALK